MGSELGHREGGRKKKGIERGEKRSPGNTNARIRSGNISYHGAKRSLERVQIRGEKKRQREGIRWASLAAFQALVSSLNAVFTSEME